MKYTTLLLEGKTPNGVIPYVINETFDKYITLGRNDSYLIKGWEVGQHGDIGSNGSRGSLNQFRKMNIKIIVGHYHSPKRIDNALSVGTTTKLRLDYNRGPSSWLHSHILIHDNGTAQHVHFLLDEDGNPGFTTIKLW